MKWSFRVLWRFSDFLDFIHNEPNIIISEICIEDINLIIKDIERGHYTVVFYIIDYKPIQLTLF